MADSSRLRPSARGQALWGRDGTRALIGPMSILQRPTDAGEVLHLPGLCLLYGMDPSRPVRVLQAGTVTYWWWEGELPGGPAPGPPPAGQVRFDLGVCP